MVFFSKLHFFSVFLSLLPVLSLAYVTLSSSLSTDTNSPWLSPSEEFAFGFQQLKNSNLFLLAIWFQKIPDKTIVWYANGNNPVQKGARVILSASGLVLTDHEGETIWETPASTVAYAAMLDSGNFVLAASGSRYVWESFKNPTDTILPTQILDLNSDLSSRITATNFSRGRFELHFNGSLLLNLVGWPTPRRYAPYYSSGNESGYQLVFNENANIYIVKRNGEVFQLVSWSAPINTADNYHRATLDFDGVFTQYAHPKKASPNQSWQPVRIIPNNICNAEPDQFGSGACGFNSICEIQNRRPNCSCPPGYVFVDPENRFSGCIPTYPQGCDIDYGSRDPEELYEIKEFNYVNFPMGDYEVLAPYDQKQCEMSCLHDCYCTVVIFDGNSNVCWKKRLPLTNGRVEIAGDTKVLFKVGKGNNTVYCTANKDEPSLFGAILGSSAIFSVVLLVISLLIFLRHRRKGRSINSQDSSVFERSLRLFTYKELEEATDQFKEEVGRGSFGIVYKTVLKSSSRNLVAVKKLDKLAQEREMEFKTEVSAIGRIHHKNLVGLLGLCVEGTHRLLVYEFMSNGTLADYLFALNRPDWHQRVQIAMNIARGLVYLHEECEVPIIHCDIKPHNILLDEYLTAKISDFGLAKLLLYNQSGTRTLIRGTRGYVAPEWFKNVPITAKVDVYSFGVMLLEIICCRKCVVMDSTSEEVAILTDWAYDCYVEGRIDILVSDDEAAIADKDRLMKWVMIALWCIQDNAADRRTMKMVTLMLEGIVEVPSPPSYFNKMNEELNFSQLVSSSESVVH